MSLPVLTVTLNPALDLTFTLDVLQLGHVHRVNSSQETPGGKGIDVAACLADWGVHAICAGLLARGNATLFEDLMRDKGIEDAMMRREGMNRCNIKLVEENSRRTTDLNQTGASIDAHLAEKLQRRIAAMVEPGQIVALCGSLPPGWPEAGYAPLMKSIVACGAKLVVDTSGERLIQVLRHAEYDLPAPWFIKPNRHELSAAMNKPLSTLAEIAREAEALHEGGIEAVVVSLGEEGSLLACPEGLFHAHALPVRPVSTVGAGDAMVAGIIAAKREGRSWPEAMKLGVAFSTAKLSLPGPNLPIRENVLALEKRAQVERLRF